MSDLTIERGTVLLDRRRPGRLVQVRYATEARVSVITIDSMGFVKVRARLRPVPVAEVDARFRVYRPCRWMLHCLVQATVTIGHSTGDIDVCAEHAVGYRKWLESIAGVIHANWDDEPEAQCFCPDDVGTSERLPVRYCPQHGTAERRGTELGDLVPVSGGAGPVLDGPDRGKFPVNSGWYFDE